MKTSDVFPTRFVSAEDLDHDITLKVEDVKLEEMYDPQSKGDIQKPVAYFQGATKGLVLNKTNWKILATLYGDESNDWKGKAITISKTEVQAFGDIVQAIRLKPPK